MAAVNGKMYVKKLSGCSVKERIIQLFFPTAGVGATKRVAKLSSGEGVVKIVYENHYP